MFNEGLVDKFLYRVKKLIPRSVFSVLAPMYHSVLAWAGVVIYGFPSKDLKVIGVTGTKGKSTTVFMISKIFHEVGLPTAAIGSLGFMIKDKTWPNNLKMTMPGRFKLQKFLYEAKKAGCKYVVLEVTSEGIKQKRHLGINFDCAVFTNLHKEHLESHGSFENYYHAKQELFKRTSNIHVLNADDPHVELFSKFSSKHTIFYGIESGDIRVERLELNSDRSSFEIYGTQFNLNFGGRFNVSNCLAAISVAAMYGIDVPKTKSILESIKNIPGRLEFIQKEPFAVVVDYAHTPDSLEVVYKTLRPLRITNYELKDNPKSEIRNRLICILGAAGGGRDKWKRPEFGRIAADYCDEIILTDEDPYEENPEKIIEDIKRGFSQSAIRNPQFEVIMDRREAIKKALADAKDGDIVVITGKGSEVSMAVAGGKKIPWSDKAIVQELLSIRE